MPKIQNKFRAFAAEKLTELANDWQCEGYDDEDGGMEDAYIAG